MNEINFEQIPASLRDLPQWVLWRYDLRGDKPTKLPYSIDGTLAQSNNPHSWNTYEAVVERYCQGDWSGIGFVFAEDGGIVGVDLDGCRDPITGVVAPWAKEIILTLDSYAEVSPSQTGVKVYVLGKSPVGGKKREIEATVIGDKKPAIEIYERGRYFAVTGWALRGRSDLERRQDSLDWIGNKFWPAAPPPKVDFRSNDAVVERARKYLATLPPAVSGSKGHDTTFRAACVLVLGFGLSEQEAMGLLREYNQACQPPWSDRELAHKIESAGKQPGERNYLRNAKPERWNSISVPEYQTSPPPKNSQRKTTLLDATLGYLERIKSGKIDIITLGLGSVDDALGGGVERGELVILAARPSHGKSAVALQVIHNLTKQQRPCVMVSEEMSALALGKRSLQYASEVPQEYWFKSHRELEKHVVDHFADRSECVIVESCRTAEATAEAVRIAVRERNIQCAVVDYAQLLTGQGKTRYEQVTNTSIVMRQLASELNIVVLLLCQLNSEIEKRQKGFRPMLSDIKDSGQFAQDADVIMFLCWPHRLDKKNNPHEYQFFFAKNRNRGICQPVVTCKFIPTRQMFQEQDARDRANYETDFDRFNERADIG